MRKLEEGKQKLLHSRQKEKPTVDNYKNWFLWKHEWEGQFSEEKNKIRVGEEIYICRGDWEMREVYIPVRVNSL